MAVSKVILRQAGTDQTLINLQGDTATANDVNKGKTFHLANGTMATGTAVPISELISGTIESIDINDEIIVRESAFESCYDLESVNLSNVSVIRDSAFKNCTDLETINIPKASAIGNGAFYQCLKLENIEVSNCSQIGTSAFESCIKLQSVDIGGADTQTDTITIYSNAFKNCTDLETITIRDISNVAILNNANAFTGTKITSSTGYIYVPSSLVASYKVATNWVSFADRIFAIVE